MAMLAGEALAEIRKLNTPENRKYGIIIVLVIIAIVGVVIFVLWKYGPKLFTNFIAKPFESIGKLFTGGLSKIESELGQGATGVATGVTKLFTGIGGEVASSVKHGFDETSKTLSNAGVTAVKYAESPFKALGKFLHI